MKIGIPGVLIALSLMTSATSLLAQAPASPAGVASQNSSRAQNLFKQSFDLLQAGEIAAAVMGFVQGLELDPDSGLGHFYLAEAYSRQEKIPLAVQHYEKAIALAPDSREGLLARSRLAEKKSLIQWIGEWVGSGTFVDELVVKTEIKGQDLIMEIVTPGQQMWNLGFRKGDIYFQAALTGNTLYGKAASIYRQFHEKGCRGNEAGVPTRIIFDATQSAIEFHVQGETMDSRWIGQTELGTSRFICNIAISGSPWQGKFFKRSTK